MIIAVVVEEQQQQQLLNKTVKAGPTTFRLLKPVLLKCNIMEDILFIHSTNN